MKKLFVFIFLVGVGNVQAQNFIEDFEEVDSLYFNDWFQQNNSSPAGSGGWEQDNGNFTAPFGTVNSSVVVGYKSIAAGQSGDISNWLISPTINMTNGDSIIFYSRSYQGTTYADRMEVRLNRSNTIDVGSTTTSVGDFDTVMLVINPTLTTGSGNYPMIWTRFGIEINGVSPSTPCRVGLRYFVTDGGQTGANSSTIGVDHFEYRSVFTGINDESSAYALIHLQNGFVNVQIPDADESASVELIDMSGRIVRHEYFYQSIQIPYDQFSNGVYVLKITYRGKYLIKKISF